MALSRKQRKQLKKLRGSASDLWDEQRNVLSHAGGVFRETGRQLGNVSKQEVGIDSKSYLPRVRGVVDGQIVPAVASGYHAGRAVASDVRDKVVKDVIPGVSSSFASALATLEDTDPRVRDAVKKAKKTSSKVGKNASKTFSAASTRASKAYDRVGTRVGLVKPKKTGLGFGGWALITLGVVVVAGIAYAAWQTLRADDELWVLDESDDVDTPE